MVNVSRTYHRPKMSRIDRILVISPELTGQSVMPFVLNGSTSGYIDDSFAERLIYQIRIRQ